MNEEEKSLQQKLKRDMKNEKETRSIIMKNSYIDVIHKRNYINEDKITIKSKFVMGEYSRITVKSLNEECVYIAIHLPNEKRNTKMLRVKKVNRWNSCNFLLHHGSYDICCYKENSLDNISCVNYTVGLYD